MIKEAQEAIEKRAYQITADYVQQHNEQVEMEKKAAEIVSGMSKEALDKYAEAQAFGRGIAVGQTMYKEAMHQKIAEDTYARTIAAIGDVFGAKVAEEIDEKLYEAGGQNPEAEKEIFDAASNAAAEALIEAHGGEEAVMNDPEKREQVVNDAQQIGAQVLEEAKAAVSGDSPVEPTVTEPQ